MGFLNTCNVHRRVVISECEIRIARDIINQNNASNTIREMGMEIN